MNQHGGCPHLKDLKSTGCEVCIKLMLLLLQRSRLLLFTLQILGPVAFVGHRGQNCDIIFLGNLRAIAAVPGGKLAGPLGHWVHRWAIAVTSGHII
jgi:hypothetical protein